MLHFTNNLTGVAKENALNGVNDMLNLAMSRQCRRKSILAKFAEAFDGNCGKCDICAGVNGEAANAVVVAQDASMFLDVVREARVTTLSKTVQILLGKGKKGKESKFFGKGNSHNDVFWNEVSFEKDFFLFFVFCFFVFEFSCQIDCSSSVAFYVRSASWWKRSKTQ